MQNGQANLAVFGLNFCHQYPESNVRFIFQHILNERRIRRDTGKLMIPVILWFCHS